MFRKSIGRNPALLGMILVMGVVLGQGRATALIGWEDSPYFPINTLWVSGVEETVGIPMLDRLVGCQPNPFNPMTTIRFELAGPSAVDLNVYDLQGRLVSVLLRGQKFESGGHEAQWNGRDARGGRVAAGVYLYRLVTDRHAETRRMTLVK